MREVRSWRRSSEITFFYLECQLASISFTSAMKFDAILIIRGIFAEAANFTDYAAFITPAFYEVPLQGLGQYGVTSFSYTGGHRQRWLRYCAFTPRKMRFSATIMLVRRNAFREERAGAVFFIYLYHCFTFIIASFDQINFIYSARFIRLKPDETPSRANIAFRRLRCQLHLSELRLRTSARACLVDARKISGIASASVRVEEVIIYSSSISARR